MFQDASSSSLAQPAVSLESASLWEDVEMTSDHPSEDLVQYITVDTNVFLQRFGLIKALYDAFTEHGNGEIKLLIPTIVINELDGLTANHSPAPHNPQITIAEAARAGTHWLLAVSRARTLAIRFQKWSERMDETLLKGDDRILDCCLYFKEKGGKGVVLWTDDRNLALLAEANEVRTVGGRGVTPKSVLERLPLSIPESLLAYLDKNATAISSSEIYHPMILDQQDDMELDLDLDQWIPPPPPIPIPIPIVSTHSSPKFQTDIPSQVDRPPFPFSSIKRQTSPSKSSKPLPPPLSSAIAITFIPFYDALPLQPTVIRRTWNVTSSPSEIIKSIVHVLETLEKAQETEGTRMNVLLLRTISAFRVLQSSIDPKLVSRRPRTGEVADALDELGVLIEKLGCPCDKADLERSSQEVRNL